MSLIKNEKNANAYRKTAVIMGILFMTATGATILNQIILGPILDTSDYLIRISENVNQVIIALLFEFINAIACVSIAISIFPVLKKFNLRIAIGYLCFRAIEATIGFIAISSRLPLLTLSQDYIKEGNSAASIFYSLGNLLLAGYDWIFLIMLMAFYLGAILFYSILFRARLVPRIIAVWGLIGALMGTTAFLLQMFGLIMDESMIAILLVLPIALNEMVLALWLIVKGFNPTAVINGRV